jgi:hypothetical protein
MKNQSLVFGTKKTIVDDVLNATPAPFSSELYFSPIQLSELQRLKEIPDENITGELEKTIVNARRKFALNLYQGIGSFALTTVFTNSLVRMAKVTPLLDEKLKEYLDRDKERRQSHTKLQETFPHMEYREWHPKLKTEFESVSKIIHENFAATEPDIDGLLSYPPNANKLTKLHTIIKSHDELVSSKIIGGNYDLGYESLADVLHLSVPERFSLYTEFGVSVDRFEYKDFDSILGLFSSGHYFQGPVMMPHYTDEQQEKMLDFLKMRIRVGNLKFRMEQVNFGWPYNNEIPDCFDMGSPKKNRFVSPVQLKVYSEGETQFAPLFSRLYSGLKQDFEQIEVDRNAKKIVLFCPKNDQITYHKYLALPA